MPAARDRWADASAGAHTHPDPADPGGSAVRPDGVADLESDAPWSRPPPGSRPVRYEPDRPRRVRVAAGVLAVVVVAAVAVWVVFGRGAAAPEAAGPPASAADPTAAAPGDGVVEPGPPADPDPPPFDTVSTALEELRASDRYVVLAEHQRAREYQWPENIDGAWVIFNRAGYANTEQLWDEVVGPIRDDALLAGEPFTEPVWNEIPVPASMPVGWSEEQTGRGDGFLFFVVFTDPAGQPVLRTHAVLVRRDAGGDGRVVARMPAFDVRREDASDYLRAVNPAADRVWEWIVAQPEEDR